VIIVSRIFITYCDKPDFLAFRNYDKKLSYHRETMRHAVLVEMVLISMTLIDFEGHFEGRSVKLVFHRILTICY